MRQDTRKKGLLVNIETAGTHQVHGNRKQRLTKTEHKEGLNYQSKQDTGERNNTNENIDRHSTRHR